MHKSRLKRNHFQNQGWTILCYIGEGEEGEGEEEGEEGEEEEG